jgi:hypothetical protein
VNCLDDPREAAGVFGSRSAVCECHDVVCGDHRQVFRALNHDAGQIENVLAGYRILQGGHREPNDLGSRDAAQTSEPDAITAGCHQPLPDGTWRVMGSLDFTFEGSEQRARGNGLKPVRGCFVSERVEGLPEQQGHDPSYEPSPFRINFRNGFFRTRSSWTRTPPRVRSSPMKALVTLLVVLVSLVLAGTASAFTPIGVGTCTGGFDVAGSTAVGVLGLVGPGKHRGNVHEYGETTSGSSNAAREAAVLGRGSTAALEKGTTLARNLRESLAIRQAAANPTAGRVLDLKMTDPRWPASEGWTKMQQIIQSGGREGPVNVHYLYNTATGAIDDFKIILQGAR